MSRLTPDDGATMVEYGVMLALIVAIAVGVVQLLGIDVRGLFESVIGF